MNEQDAQHRHTRRPRLRGAVTIVLVIAASTFAQKRANTGAGLHNNLQQYTLRGDMGHKLDSNLALESGGYNTSGAAMRGGTYNARRVSNYSPVAQQAARNQRSENITYYKRAADITRNQYSPPMYSEAYRDALARTGRNPNVNPFTGK
jgi:hypothetical protein